MSATPDQLREMAVKRVRERHDFASHIVLLWSSTWAWWPCGR
jgi:hypothetical protein